jgi:hypothetical protein
MSQTRAKQFIDALTKLEHGDGPDALVELFADRCTVQNLTLGTDLHGIVRFVGDFHPRELGRQAIGS